MTMIEQSRRERELQTAVARVLWELEFVGPWPEAPIGSSHLLDQSRRAFCLEKAHAAIAALRRYQEQHGENRRL